MDNLEKIKNLIPLWYAQRKWAEELLVRVFHLASAEEILEPKHRGSMTIPGTHWVYRTHGVGVDIYRTASVGGIDFDFNKPDPDEWRLTGDLQHLLFIKPISGFSGSCHDRAA
ncbi:hypothetical protein ACK312_07100 [Aeromonas caviae]